MKALLRSYGKKTYDAWLTSQPRNLKPTETSYAEADQNLWSVRTYRSLLEAASFLSAMNKRLTLFFRGQSRNIDPLPTIFRGQWQPLQSGAYVPITDTNRSWYFNHLADMGREVYTICDSPGLGLPRWRGLRDIREIQWAIIQHYGIWPTPLIDITSSLRVAASFAFGLSPGSPSSPKVAYLYVIGLPYATEWISSHHTQGIVLARLQSACPPVAKRPHFQDGFLLGASPLNSLTQDDCDRSRLTRRLVAKFELHDAGDFWDCDFPVIRKGALMPTEDRLLDRLYHYFGPSGTKPVRTIAEGSFGEVRRTAG
jgi:FRG domain